MKSLRRQGREILADACSRLSSEPRKNSSSVSTDSAAAPACSNSRASSAGRKSARIKPFEGDAFLSSAMIAGPCCEVRRSRSRNPLGMCSAAFRSKARKSAPRWLSETRFRVADTMESREGGMNINYTEAALGSEFRLRIKVLFDRYRRPVFCGPENGDDF